ncbi:MAG: M23 family metallopeptidase [Gemmatimonadota bacterium]
MFRCIYFGASNGARRFPFPPDPLNRALVLLVLAVLFGGVALASGGAAEREPTTFALPAAGAVGVRLDTLLLGGYSAGAFGDAVQTLAGDLSAEERVLIGDHLDRIFGDVVPSGGVGRTGRLRLAYERALRPDGTTRSIRVLGAELAVAGRLHTALYFERDGRPGYFDPFGRALDLEAWSRPLASSRVSSAFGRQRLHPILNRVLPHTGVDLAAPTGEPVRATADGLVAEAGERGGYGLLVELQHPSGYSTRYAHLSRLGPGVSRARVVRQGDIIGYVGMSGTATGPHLHYEVRRRGQPMDPLRVIAETGIPSDAGSEPSWPAERRRLAALLAQAPTVLGAN